MSGRTVCTAIVGAGGSGPGGWEGGGGGRRVR